jgi:phytoene synthase
MLAALAGMRSDGGARLDATRLIIEPAKVSDVAGAFAYCERLARRHYENFPVGSWLLPAGQRRHVYSLYAFARTADDFADEGDDPPESRLAALDDWGRRLEGCYRGEADHPIFIALAQTAKELDLPAHLFRDLLSAFRQDVVKRRYEDFDEVRDYCRRSANPIGRLILALFGYRQERLLALADEICTGLQLANFWQDVGVDLAKDRIYLPRDERQRFKVTEEDLRARRFNAEYAQLLEYQIARTRLFFARGRPLPELVRGRLRYELRLIWHGGMRLLERIAERGYDTLNARPRITSSDQLRLLAKALAGR